MKNLKTFESFKNNNKVYYIENNPSNSYKYLVILSDNYEILGFITPSQSNEELKESGICTIGSVYGPSYGDLLYDSFIKKFGRIIPSSNISDVAKISWLKRLKNPKYVVYQIDGIGFYDVYPAEKVLNSVIDLKPEIKNKIKIYDIEELGKDVSKRVYTELDKLHKEQSNIILRDKEYNYTFGQSRDRWNWLKKFIQPMPHYSKTQDYYFKKHNIPFYYNDNEMAKKFLSLC